MTILYTPNQTEMMETNAIPSEYESLLTRIKTKNALVGIIGLGYVGLPLARAFSSQGFRVLGFDIDAAKVAQLRRGQSYIGHIAADTLLEMNARGFSASDDFSRL